MSLQPNPVQQERRQLVGRATLARLAVLLSALALVAAGCSGSDLIETLTEEPLPPGQVELRQDNCTDNGLFTDELGNCYADDPASLTVEERVEAVIPVDTAPAAAAPAQPAAGGVVPAPASGADAPTTTAPVGSDTTAAPTTPPSVDPPPAAAATPQPGVTQVPTNSTTIRTQGRPVTTADYIGKPSADAAAVAVGQGYVVNMANVDGVANPPTGEFDVNRLNFTVIDGIVTSVSIG